MPINLPEKYQEIKEKVTADSNMIPAQQIPAVPPEHHWQYQLEPVATAQWQPLIRQRQLVD